MELERYLTELSDPDKPVVVSKLINLTDLSREEIEVFKRLWPEIAVARRREIVGDLAEVAEENLELDLDKVLRLCLRDEDAGVKTKAIEGLWQSEERSLLDEFISLLADKMPSVRAAAAGAMGKYAMLAELGKLLPGDAERIEQSLLSVYNNKDEQEEVRRRSLEAVSPLSRPEVKELIKQAYDSDIARMKVSAVFAMGQNCDTVWLPILLIELNNQSPEMRFEAARALGELEAEEAVPRLIRLTRDSDPEVRVAAIASLGKIGGSAAKARLRQCTASTDEAVREAAREALKEIGFWEDPFNI